VNPHVRWSRQGVKIPTDQKVGGSSRSERAQVISRLPDGNRLLRVRVQQPVQQPADGRLLDAGLAGTGRTGRRRRG
jgi:hypothetical protein